MVDSNTAMQIHSHVEAIKRLAAEIEAIPNLLPDMWTMKKVDKKCQEIQRHCQSIGALVGSGDGRVGNTGDGTHRSSGDG